MHKPQTVPFWFSWKTLTNETRILINLASGRHTLVTQLQVLGCHNNFDLTLVWLLARHSHLLTTSKNVLCKSDLFSFRFTFIIHSHTQVLSVKLVMEIIILLNVMSQRPLTSNYSFIFLFKFSLLVMVVVVVTLFSKQVNSVCNI